MAPDLFNDSNSVSILVQYSGDIKKEVEENPNANVYIIDNSYAILSIKIDYYDRVLNSLKSLVYIESDGIYTLNEISPVAASKAPLFHNNPFLTLNGKGVMVGIIDTGIDYLNAEFTREDDTTRVERIWDQTIESNQQNALLMGTVYTEDDINKAIKLKLSGGDPYTVVPSIDTIGHGTKMAGIIGARGKDKNLIGAAPDCTFVVVKLKESDPKFLDYFLTQGSTPKYDGISILLALKYLYALSIELQKPLVIYIPLGSNIGAHDGTSVIEKYIDNFSIRRGVVAVTSTGNQGNEDIHTQGRLKNSNDSQLIELNIPKGQKGIFFNIYTKKPDIVTISIISPSGEVIEDISAKDSKVELANAGVTYKFVFEGTEVNIIFFPFAVANGDGMIIIRATNLKPGIWQFRINGRYIVNGDYDAWLLQRELLAPETRFLKSVPYTTLTIPSTSKSIIATSYYNQNNNAIVSESGRGFTRDNRIKPIITAGGINALTTQPGGGTTTVSGGSVASAVTAGCIALLLQWGIVDKNDTKMFAVTVETYLIRGVSKRPGDIYPNEQWGYGMLNMEGVFVSLKGSGGPTMDVESYRSLWREGYYVGDLFIRNPYI